MAVSNAEMFSKMVKTKLVKITPAMAAKYLEKNSQNRPASQSRVDQFARDMVSGHWLLNHQGIAFDSEGNLIDGQHRLLAIIKSGKTIEMLVTTGLPCAVSNGIKIHTMDTVDRGRPRGVGQQLNLRHGFQNGNLVAACARVCAEIATGATVPSLTTAQTLRVLEVYGASINECIDDVQMATDRKAAIVGTIAFAVAGNETVGREFSAAFFGMENLQKTHPAMVLRKWMSNHPIASYGGARTGFVKVIASSIYNFSQQKNIAKIYQSDEAMDWLRAQQPKNVRTVCEILA